MKPILVTQRLIEDSGYHEVRDALDVQWSRFLHRCGYIAVPMGIHSPLEQFFGFENIGGVLLTGGNDLYAVSRSRLSRLRDEFETRVLHLAEKRQLPVLGVCRGMQMIMNLNGAKLVEITGHTAVDHDVGFRTGTLLSDIYGERCALNSFHGYSARSCDGAEILGNSDDGEIEAVRVKGTGQWGIMWHPERETPFREIDIKLFRTIFK